MSAWVTAVSASTGSTRLDAVTPVASTTTASCGTSTTRVTSVRCCSLALGILGSDLQIKAAA